MTFVNFEVIIRYEIYKRGITFKMLAMSFDVSTEYMSNILEGKYRDTKAITIIRELIKYYT